MVRFSNRFLTETGEKSFSKGIYLLWLEKKFEESLTKTHTCRTCNAEIDATVKDIFGKQLSFKESEEIDHGILRKVLDDLKFKEYRDTKNWFFSGSCVAPTYVLLSIIRSFNELSALGTKTSEVEE